MGVRDCQRSIGDGRRVSIPLVDGLWLLVALSSLQVIGDDESLSLPKLLVILNRLFSISCVGCCCP